MVTRTDIHAQLAAMGAPQDRPVIVHTSLRAVGEVEGRGDGLLDALITYFTAHGGLCCIPTHNWDSLKYTDRITMDMRNPQTCIGTLPNLAAARPEGHRSLHPTHSTTVFGAAERAEAFISGEPTNLTSTGPEGCYGRLWREDGYVLLIGVGHERNTYIHAAEELLGVPNRISSVPREGSIRLPSGEIIRRPVYYHKNEGITPFVSYQYPKYEPAFRHHGCITDGKIGQAPAMLCSARKMYDVIKLIYERSGGAELLADAEPLDERLWK